ncbi:MAG: YncE family protein [Thermoplasmata archaeon]|nr:YncE family protein [Thermoplasmata archaeon]
MTSPRRGTVLPTVLALGLVAALLVPGSVAEAGRAASPPAWQALNHPPALSAHTAGQLPAFEGFSHQTLPLLNGSLLPGNPNLASGTGPVIATADPTFHRIFLLSTGAGSARPSIDVVNETTNRLAGEVPLSGYPDFILLAAAGRLVIAGMGGPSALTLLNASSGAVVARISLAYDLVTAAVNPPTDELFVECWGGPVGSIVGVVNLTTYNVTSWIPVGSGGAGIVDDPVNGFLYVANPYSNSVSVINGTNHSVAATISIANASSLAVDPNNGTVYVLNQFTPINLTIVNTTSNSVFSTIPLVSPYNTSNWGNLAIDASSHRLYVALSYSDNLTIVSTTSNTVVGSVTVGYDLEAIALDALVGVIVVSFWGTHGELRFFSAGNGSFLGRALTYEWNPLFCVDEGTGFVDVAGASTDRLRILNASSASFVANVSVGLTPDGILYDPFNGDLYVSETDAGVVTILNASTKTLVGSVATGEGASNLKLCPSVDRVFVSNSGSGTVSVLNATTNSVVATVKVSQGLGDMAWDPADGDVFVTSGGGIVSVLNGTTGSLVANISGFPNPPTRAVFDPANGQVYLMDIWGGPVAVVNGTTYRVIANVSLGNGTGVDIEYEPITAEVWVVTSWPGVLMAISGRTNSIVTKLSLPTPGIFGMAVEASTGTILVTLQGDSFEGIEEFVNASSATKIGIAAVGIFPSSILFDVPANLALVANVESANLSVLNLSTHRSVATIPTGANPTNLAIDPASSTVFCTNNGVGTLTVLGPAVPHEVRFTELGLPHDTNWTVALDGVNASSASAALSINAANGTHAFSVPQLPGYFPTPASGNVTVNGAAVNATIHFLPAYKLAFSETGLANGTPWTVILNGSTLWTANRSIAVQEPNGSYAFRVADVPGWRADTYGGSVQVAGAAATIDLNWTRLNYALNFTASGLPGGRSWAVLVNGQYYRSPTGFIGLQLPNGTYPYSVAGAPGFAPVNATGVVTVGGSAQSLSVRFTKGFLIRVHESGLSNGTVWSARVNGSLNFSSASTLDFEVPNGTFHYDLPNVAGWRADGYSGSISVAGSSQFVNVSWHQAVYQVWFAESGLPNGHEWSVTVAGAVHNGSSDHVIVWEPNGSIPYTLANIPGWHSDLYSGSVNINDTAIEVTFTWTRVVFLVTFSEVGLPVGQPWSVLLNGSSYLESSSAVILGQRPNGTVPYEVGFVAGWQATAYYGHLSIEGGPDNVTVVWKAVTYPIQFEQVGLPSGTPWAVSAYGETNRSTGSIVNWTEPNGTYVFNVSNLPGWRASAYSFSVEVRDQPVVTTVAWQRDVYAVTVSAMGLPSGHPWSATLDGTQHEAQGPTVTFPSVPNGSYSLTSSASGYAPTLTPVQVRVDGAAVSVDVQFAPTPFGIPGISLLLGIGIGVVALVGVGAIGLSVRARRRANGGGSPTPVRPLRPSS